MTATPFEGVDNGSIAFADVDGDNDQDIIITGSDNSDNPSTKLYINSTMIMSSNNVILSKNQVRLYPNPTKNEQIYLNYSSEKTEEIQVTLFDLSGKSLFQQNFHILNGSNSIQLPFPTLTRGAYFVKINNGINSTMLKLIIEE